jgi:hypothetical protein
MSLLYNQNSTINKKTKESEVVLTSASQSLVEVFPHNYQEFNPLFLKNRTLTISCSGPATAQLIRDKQTLIIDKINVKLGKKEVDRIRYLL